VLYQAKGFYLSLLSLKTYGQIFIVIENLFKFVNYKADLFYHLIWFWVLSEFYRLYYTLIELFPKAVSSFDFDIGIPQTYHVCQHIRIYFVQDTFKSLDFPSPIVTWKLLTVG